MASYFFAFFTNLIASLETQGQLVGWKGFLWVIVYYKSERAPGHLLFCSWVSKDDLIVKIILMLKT